MARVAVAWIDVWLRAPRGTRRGEHQRQIRRGRHVDPTRAEIEALAPVLHARATPVDLDAALGITDDSPSLDGSPSVRPIPDLSTAQRRTLLALWRRNRREGWRLVQAAAAARRERIRAEQEAAEERRRAREADWEAEQAERRARGRVDAPIRAIVCPKCGSGLRYRRRRLDGVEFIGCSAFPRCRFACDVEADHARMNELLDAADQALGRDPVIAVGTLSDALRRLIVQWHPDRGVETLSAHDVTAALNALRDQLRSAD